MPMRINFAENQVILSFVGNLDVTVSRDIFRVCSRVSPGLKSCIVDLSDTACLFDSGLALLQVLYRRLVDNGTKVTIRTGCPAISERVFRELDQNSDVASVRWRAPCEMVVSG